VKTSDKELLVSIVIPVFNRGELLAKVFEGLQRQTVSAEEFEILICDDGSTEDLSPILDRFKDILPQLKYLKQSNKGPAATRNLGIRAAVSDKVLFLDSDVLPEENLVKSLSTALEANANWVGAEARVEPCDGEDSPLWDAPVCNSGGVYLTAAIIYQKNILEKIGGFDQAFLRAACEDVELATRAMKYGKIGFVSETSVKHPRRKKNFNYYWRKRGDWKYVLFVALRHGFISWPENPTNSPRLRLLWCALVTQPGGRLFNSITYFNSKPADGLEAMGHAIFSWFCGVAAIADILFLKEPPRIDYLKIDQIDRQFE